ncbi:MAG: beta-ketoacyl synthase N-terminal-like domain-containing protein [Sandaracinaceae bacterium]
MSVRICGVGAVSALGMDAPSLKRALFAGRHGLAPVTRFDTAELAPVHLGACVPEGDDCARWAVSAATEAWRDAGLEGIDAARIAVVAGTTEGQEGDITGLARDVAEAIGARGARLTISTACSSSANAIGIAHDLLTRGEADAVIAGGAERLVPEMYAGFHRLGVLSEGPCAPFGETPGTTLGEGAGFVVLTRDEGAGAARAYLHGYGLASDAWHETTPEPRGGGIARAIGSAMRHAGVEPDGIDYVNAHGTGTATNDDAEWRGIRLALGPRAEHIAVSSTKSSIGHAQGAAGALELIATLLALEEGALPATLRVGAGRPGGPPDPIASDVPRASSAVCWLSDSAAFGGANAVLCAGLRPVATPARARQVVLLGTAHVRGRTTDRELAGVDLKGTDPSSRACLRAALSALERADVRVRGGLRERAGVFGGATRVSPESLREYRGSIEKGGLRLCSAAAFARLVLHAPIGLVSRRLALRGPTTTVAGEGNAGLLALAYAADAIGARDDADVMLAIGFDERGAEADDEASDDEAEGAVCAVLGVEASDGPIVCATAYAPPGDVGGAIFAALVRAGLVGARTSLHVYERPTAAPARDSLATLLDAERAIREGGEVAVAAAVGGGASVAVVLAARSLEGAGGGRGWTRL